jgi:predicted naringenin-chalcone synthase
LPARIRQWFRDSEELMPLRGAGADDLWAVHPGGRLILDSVQEACGLTDEQMAASREILRRYGNLSSASIMFILQALLADAPRGRLPRAGRAVAFGPGLTVETMEFSLLPVADAAPERPRELMAVSS